jgi:hypothetical protein
MAAISLPEIRLVAVPKGARPVFFVDAVAAEEDTYLVLSADPVVEEVTEEPERLLSDAAARIPLAPGTVLVRGGEPLELLAVVHDLDQEPTWREEWVAGALDEIMREVFERGLGSLAMPMLGAVHGSLEGPRFVELLANALEAGAAESLKELWLLVVPERVEEVALGLREAGLDVVE